MDFGTFLGRMWTMFWGVLFLGFTVMTWVATIKAVIQDSLPEAIFTLLFATIFTAAFLASNAIQLLGR
jgi:hypothetical protein